MTIAFGVGIPQGWRMDLTEISDPVAKYAAMTSAAQEADTLGYDSLWLFDHFHTIPTPELETTFECFTALAGLARDTKQIRLGQMATCNGYRNPALLAKIGSTIDVMSNGRFILGFGAGWYEHEYRAYGYGFPDTKERMARFREATQIIRKMWTEEYPTFQGKYYEINGPINEPKGVQKPHPPLWLAGSGEQVTLKLVAQYGQGCNISNTAELAHKLGILKQHCDTFNTNYDALSRSTSLTVHIVDSDASAETDTAEARKGRSLEEYQRQVRVGTSAQIIAYLESLVQIGTNYFILYPPRVAYDHTQMQRFAREVMPHFRNG